MKKILISSCTALALACTTSFTQAALLAYDSFDYGGTSPGSDLTGLNGGTGWASAWEPFTTATPLRLSDTAMTYPDLPTIGTAMGMVSNVDGSPTGSGRVFASASARDFVATDIGSGTLYFSGLVQSYFNADLGAVFRLHSNTTNANGAVLSFWFNGGNVGISDGWNATPGASLGTYSGDVALAGPTTSTFFVFKYDYSTQLAELFLNPDATMPEPGIATISLDFTDARGAIGALTPTIPGDYGTWDELRVGTSWGAVIPEPTSAAMLLGGLGLLALRRRR